MSSHEHLAENAPPFLQSPRMQPLMAIIQNVAESGATVLIRGETGVGKEIVAHAIHAASARHDRPFIKVNCVASPGERLESDLFGHEKGAFPRAYRRKLGKFEFANTGTIFLDEMGQLPLTLQAKFLHVLQDLQFTRVGSRETIRVDVRVLAATNRDLEAAVGCGEFREDLYHRLKVIEIQVPPLRERKEDIPALASFFLAKFNQRYQRDAELCPETVILFTEYSWPGNIRELENLVQRLVVTGKPQEIHEEIQSRLRP